MKKQIRILTVIMAFIMMTAAVLITSAQRPQLTPDEIAIVNNTPLEIEANDVARNVRPDATFDITIRFQSNFNSDIKPLTAMSFGFDNVTPFVLMQGSESVNNAGTDIDYNFRFQVPPDTPAGKYYIRYSVDFSYTRTYSNATGPSLDNIVRERKSFSAAITVSADGVSDDSGTVRIENLEAADVAIGHEAALNVTLINTAARAFNNVRAEILDGGTVIAQRFIGSFDGGSSSMDSFVVPAFKTAGNKHLTLRITYTDGTVRTVQQDFMLRVTANVPLVINSFTAPHIAAAESPVTISFNLLNRGDEEYRNAQIRLYNGTRTIHLSFLGAVPAQASTPVSFEHTFSRAETAELRLLVTYHNAADDALRVERNFTLTVNAASELEISEVNPPPGIEVGTATDIPFSLVNRGSVEFRNVQAFLYRNGRQVRSLFIGAVGAQSGITNSINYIFNSEQGAYELRVTYENAVGTALEARQSFTPAFKAGAVGGDSGNLRIQSVTPPPDTLIKTTAIVTFRLTNPTQTDIAGVEASLYDAAGIQTDSIYISEVGRNSMVEIPLSFIAKDTAGSNSYTIQVTYRGADGVSHTLERRFSVNTVVEMPDPQEPQRPANVIIQRIENPAALYTNVATDIPYRIVNAGRGPAHQVQVYIEDSDGTELAREYIGTIAEAGTVSEKIQLRFDETGEPGLTMFVTYENADESTGSAQRSFTQRVINYRASVTDIAGHEWIMAGDPSNIEFSVLNNGSETLLNANAVLTDAQGNSFGEVFIGTIEPGTKKERLRFRNISFWEAGETQLTITVTYENADMKEFTLSNSVTAMVNEMWRPDFGGDDGMIMNPEWDDGMAADGEGSGVAWWIWVLIFGGVGVAGIIVLVIFLRKGARKRENEEMENFIKLMASGGGIPAEPHANVANTANTENNEA